MKTACCRTIQIQQGNNRTVTACRINVEECGVVDFVGTLIRQAVAVRLVPCCCLFLLVCLGLTQLFLAEQHWQQMMLCNCSACSSEAMHADAFPGDPLKVREDDMTPSRDLSGHVLPQTPSMQHPSWAIMSGTTDTPYAGPQGSELPISSPFQVHPFFIQAMSHVVHKV